MGRLFGTDGVRGIANRDLSCELAFQIGAVGAYVLTNEVHSPRILIGMDTRKSGPMLGAALSAGICSVGGDVLDVGILPTPAMAYLVRLYEADAAVMISASHNPMEYNGIKWFDKNGFKLLDEIEDRIESIIQSGEKLPRPEGREVGRVISAVRAKKDYCDYLVEQSEYRFEGLRIVLDCAHGASSFIAKEVFERLGAEVIAKSCAPDGININDHCGSTHPERLQEMVVNYGADLGFAFDGDADRLISCDEYGNIVDGDQAMGILALHMHSKGTLAKDTLVLTVMSNLGLKNALKEAGVSIVETKVGDRYVLESMLANGYSIGGEQSGHIILLSKNTTGDGIMSALAILGVVAETKKRLSKLAAKIPQYPQVLVNVTVENDKKADALADEELATLTKQIEDKLGKNGRVLIRASGTEPLVRIMLEGQDEQSILDQALSLAHIIVRKYNGKIRT
jgi:phosphoglucosamine mutase